VHRLLECLHARLDRRCIVALDGSTQVLELAFDVGDFVSRQLVFGLGERLLDAPCKLVGTVARLDLLATLLVGSLVDLAFVDHLLDLALAETAA
jgi:hypothetical protein